jgi:glycogen debranching enzyme
MAIEPNQSSKHQLEEKPAEHNAGSNTGSNAGSDTNTEHGVRTNGPRTAPLGRITTLVRGATVALSTESGDVRPDAVLGFFDHDVRFISSRILSVDGDPAPVLDSMRTGPSTERIVLLGALDRYSNGSVIVTHQRTVTNGTVHENLEVRSLQGPRTVVLEVELQADGAGILVLKGGETPPPPQAWTLGSEHDTPLVDASQHAPLLARAGGLTHVFASTDAQVSVDADKRLRLTWKVELDGQQAWNGWWQATACSVEGAPVSDSQLRQVEVVAADHRWKPAIRSAIDDLNALTIEYPVATENDTVHLRFLAAGAPWFLALFGRDMLLAAWQTVPLGTDLALDVLDTLAHFQGKTVDVRRLEAPGKILHERRIGLPQVFGLEEGQSYFGTVDASPLFVHLLAECHRWGGNEQRIKALLPAARAALQWCGEARNLGPDPSFLWYQTDDRGLQNQAWKDSGDCMVHRDGSLAAGPFATAEVQGYFHDALVAMAELEARWGNADDAVALHGEAALLRTRFEDAFWHEEAGLLAMALDGKGEPLLVASSNMGHALWSGIMEPPLARKVADRIMQSDLFSPWGIRTLGDTERAYNPLGYHLGTVWAHDTAFIAAGMARHGFNEHAAALIDAILDAAEKFDWRLPELFGGLDTRDANGAGAPLPYPASCSPQAWSAGAPLLLLRAAMGADAEQLRVAATVRITDADTHPSFDVSGIVVDGRRYRVRLFADGLRCTLM